MAKSKLLNGWPLFCVIASIISFVVIALLLKTDTSTSLGIRAVTASTARCAVSVFAAIFLTGPLSRLWQSQPVRWLVVNRRYLGFAFALTMGWHLSFIILFYSTHNHEFMEFVNIYGLSIDVIAYLLIIAMTVTSFLPIKKRMHPKSWRRLHTVGIYLLWLMFTVTNIAFVSLDPSVAVFRAIIGSLLVAGAGLRIAVWWRQRANHGVAMPAQTP